MKILHAFSGLSVKNSDEAKSFYESVLELKITTTEMGLQLDLPGGGHVFMYEKFDHQPATFTVLNFVVESIDDAIDQLVERGVVLERYDDLPAPQDDKGVLRGKSADMGPDIAWFKDPSGNILAILEE